MGLLAGNRSRTKISQDPNNTKWARDTTTFGQKILRAQGWQPGQYLGAQDAPHAELHTAANASFVRVALKDDMKGLGFDRAKEDVVTGLDVFSDLLSRLNGKSEAAIAEDQRARLEVKTSAFVEQRWGPMRFVRGGLLVGDELKTEEKEPGHSAEKTKNTDAASEGISEPKKKEKKSKKRKVEALQDEDEAVTSSSDKAKSKKRRKDERDSGSLSSKEEEHRVEKSKSSRKDKRSKRRKTESNSIDDAEQVEAESSLTERKAKSKSKKEKKRKEAEEEEKEAALSSAENSTDTPIKSEKKDKKEKREKKDKKDKKKRKKDQSETETEKHDTSVLAKDVLSPSNGTSGLSTPAAEGGSGTSTPQGSRNFVRSRFIAQKRQAVLDTKALNQIFMIKT